MPLRPGLEPSPQEVLADMLAQLQREFGAVVLDARDDVSGAIRVDLRISVAEARRLSRERLHERRWSILAASHASVGISAELVDRATLLVRTTGDVLRERDQRLEAVRLAMAEVRATLERLRAGRRPADSGTPG